MKKNYQMGAIIMLLLFMAPITLAQPSFYNKIKIPPLVEVAEGDTIKLELGMYRHEFNPQSPTQDNVLNGYTTQNGIQSWAYNVLDSNNMSILGPTLLWRANEQIKIQETNHLNQPTTTHWHSAEVPAKFDGGPHQPISVDSTWMVDFVDLDGTSTMWYHPHYHDNTYPQVQMGLSGMIISVDSTDGINNTLPRTYDPVDFVLYPNPSTGLLYLRGKSTENTTVRVVSLNGQVLREEQLTSFTGDWPIDIAGVSNGVYLVVWETSKGTLAKKVVIE